MYGHLKDFRVSQDAQTNKNMSRERGAVSCMDGRSHAHGTNVACTCGFEFPPVPEYSTS